MKWIGKDPDELQVLDSAYHKMREQEFLEFLLSVQEYRVDDMKEFKKVLVKKYRKDFFDDILANNGTISNEKLQEICNRYSLMFEVLEDAENRRKTYSIKDIRLANNFKDRQGSGICSDAVEGVSIDKNRSALLCHKRSAG